MSLLIEVLLKLHQLRIKVQNYMKESYEEKLEALIFLLFLILFLHTIQYFMSSFKKEVLKINLHNKHLSMRRISSPLRRKNESKF